MYIYMALGGIDGGGRGMRGDMFSRRLGGLYTCLKPAILPCARQIPSDL